MPGRPSSPIRARGWWRHGPRRAERSSRSRVPRRCWRPWRPRASPARAGRSRGSFRGAGGSDVNGSSSLASDERGSVLFEAPSRLAATLRDLAAACGQDRPGAVCRELTKLHEQVARGTLGALAAWAADGTIPARGEIVVVVGWASGAGPRRRGGVGRGRGADRRRGPRRRDRRGPCRRPAARGRGDRPRRGGPARVPRDRRAAACPVPGHRRWRR